MLQPGPWDAGSSRWWTCPYHGARKLPEKCQKIAFLQSRPLRSSSRVPPLFPRSLFPSFRLRVEADQRLGSDRVALAHQPGEVHVERRLGLCAGKQLVDGRERRRDGAGGCPGVLEQVEADGAGAKVDVGMANGRLEADGRGVQRIVRWERNVQRPPAA